MKVNKYDNEEDWLDARRGRVTGTRLKDLILKRATKPKAGFYEIIAERVAIPAGEERALDRGVRLEDEAIERFEKETGKKVNSELVIWERDDNENIAISPDGSIGKTEAVEVKCLSSAKHIEAWLLHEVPDEYQYQVIQYFVVNEELEKLYFVFYDPRMPKDFFYLEINRMSVQNDIIECLATEIEALAKIAEIEKQLTF